MNPIIDGFSEIFSIKDQDQAIVIVYVIGEGRFEVSLCLLRKIPFSFNTFSFKIYVVLIKYLKSILNNRGAPDTT